MRPPQGLSSAIPRAFDTFDEVMALAVSSGVGNADTTITFDANTIIVLKGVARATLTANDFDYII